MHFTIISLKRAFSFFLLVLMAGMWAPVAQATDVEPHVLPVAFSAKGSGLTQILFTVYAEGSSPVIFENVYSSETSSNVAMLKPGKQYWADFWISGSAEHWVSFVAPSGYQLYIDGVPRDHFHHAAGAHDQDIFSIELRPVSGMGFLDAGTFSGIDIGQAIAWELGAGGLRSGHSVNRVSFRQFDLTGNPASRDKLLYTPPIGTWQVNVIRDGPSSQTLRQIASPQKVLDFVDDVSGGYWVKYYNYDDTDLIGGMYVPKSGKSPWKTIRVESPAVGQLKITETEGSATKVSLLTLTTQPPSTLATGGTVTSSGGYTRHTFTSSGTFTPNIPLTVEYLVVAGGGGGGGQNWGSGGGGGGGIVYNASASVSSATSVTVGAGGAVGDGANRGSNGGNSSFGAATAYGGGGGGSFPNGPTGGNGGTGGGGAGFGNASGGSGSQGYSGGQGGTATTFDAGGGGGSMAAAGSYGTGDVTGGVGASGLVYTISGANVYYGGGGGGGFDGPYWPYAAGGLGGGGNGAMNSMAATAGAANYGGGGGGGDAHGSGTGADGGSGIVIVKYPSTVTTGTVASGTYTWKLEEGDGTTVLRTTTYDSVKSGSTREAMVTVRTGNSSGTIVSETKYIYTTSGGLEDLTQVIANPNGGSNALTTTYDYYATSTDKGNYRRVKSVVEPTGNWTAYQYYNDWDRRGQVQYQFRPWLDSPSSVTLNTAQGLVTSFDYVEDPNNGRYSRPSSQQVKINNVSTGKTLWTYDNSASSGPIRRKADVDAYRDASNYQRTRMESVDPASGDIDQTGEPCVVKNPDGSQTSISRSGGGYDSSTKVFTVSGDYFWRELRVHGSTSSSGAESQTSYDSQSFDQIYLIPNQSTMEVTIRGVAGYVVRKETRVYTGSGAWSSAIATEDIDYDLACRPTQSVTGTGATTTNTWTNGRISSVVDPTGTETQFTYDSVGRALTTVKKGASASGSYAAQGDITNTYTYDGANRVTQTVSSGGALSQTTTSTYDLAGRLTQSVAPGSYTTTFAYSSGGKIVTATLPGGATRIDETYLDGQPKSQTGTAVVASYTGYTVNSSPGTITRQVNFGTSTSTALVKVTTDWLGRPITEVKPGWNGSDVTKSWTYGNSGQLTKVTQPGLADTLFSYDTMGALFRECLDVGANGTIDLSSSDRITEHGWTFFTASSNWWRRQTTTTYATASSATATQVGKVETQISGLPSNRFTRTDTTDIFGNVTSQYVDVNRSGKLVTTTTDAPDSTTDAVTIAYNGLTMSSRDTAGITTTFGHDALGRPVTSVDPRTGTTTTSYVSGTSQVYTVTDAASIVQATYTYDSAGRVSSVKDALNKYAYTSYTNRGEVYRQWGDTTYPVEYGYDNWGRRITMNTYRAGTGWTGSTWPGSTPTADVTQWNFQEATGLLSSKVSAYGTADAQTVSYTYTQAGQIDVRTWARGVTTNYDYSSTIGELLTVDYSDSTPDLTYTYNRLGSTATVVDSTGTRTFNYNLAGTLEMQNEDLPSFFGTRRVTYPRASSGVIGRPTGVQLGTTGSPTAEQNVIWGYDTYGRFNSLAGGGTTLAYSYTSNSHLLASIADSTSGWTQTRTYLSNRDLLDVIETKISATTKGKFDYGHDNLGRRTSVAKTGELYARYGNGTQGLDTTWGYDDRSQVTSEVTKLGATGTVLTGRNDGYAFDNIGNRSSTAGTTHNGNTASYTTNALNQYTQRTVPGVFDVAGAAGSGTTVTVNSSNTGVTRHGEYFFKGHGLSNSPNAVFSTLAVSDGTTTANIAAFLAGTPEAFTYDDDGNMLSDGRWDYVYDAENRLVSMQTHTALSPAPLANADARRVEFRYDYLGRRVQKTVRDGWNGSTYTTVVSDEKFVYHGWNAIAKLNAASSNTLVASYYWGLDWSGTLQGAGGVGGLALSVEGGNTYLPMFDGNGNVLGMIKASTGSIEAAYEYDAFGQTLRESGSYASSNPWRFATKYLDNETGIIYYNRRYYDPRLGRFLSRDPMEEMGGLNLYAYCRNNGVNTWDYLGMYSGGFLACGYVGLTAQLDAMFKEVEAENRARQELKAELERQLKEEAKAIGQKSLDNWSNGEVAAYMAPVIASNMAWAYQQNSALAASMEATAMATIDAYGQRGMSGGYAAVDAYSENLYDSQIGSRIAEMPALTPGNPNIEPTAPNNTATTNPTGFRDLSAGQTPVLINPNANVVSMPTCMDCHAQPWQDRAQISLPMDQPWFNRDGTETATKVFLITSTVPAIVGVGMAEAPALTMLTLKTFLDLYSPPTPIEQPKTHPPVHRPVPTGPAK